MRRSVCCLAFALAAMPGFVPAAEDLYRAPICLGSGPTDDDAASRGVLKFVRWPYALEQPFHVLPGDQLQAPAETRSSIRVLAAGHGGIVVELDSASAPTPALTLFSAFPRGPDVSGELCRGAGQDRIPASRIVTDPLTGNLFVGRIDGDLLDLAVLDRDGAELVRIRLGLLRGTALQDLSVGGEAPNGLPEEFYRFDRERLTGFVDAYRRIGKASYARFIADAFLAEAIYWLRAEWKAGTGPRLPYLPVREIDEAIFRRQGVENLRGLRNSYYQDFSPSKPRKGGVSCALMPVLKMLEDRDCRAMEGTLDDTPKAGSCPDYSAMAVQTELIREYPESVAERAYSFFEVFEVLAERGTCSSDSYPLLTGLALGRSDSVESFGARAEERLSRLMRERRTDPPEGFDEFFARHPEETIRFVDQLPPECLLEMDEFTRRQGLAAHDLVDLYTVQPQLETALGRKAAGALIRAQKEELYHLLVRLLEDGLLVGVAGDQGFLNRHGELAYGWSETGFLLMNSADPDPVTRRRTSVPFEKLKRAIAGVAYLRSEVRESRATEAQLRRSLEIAPEIDWTHRRLRELSEADPEQAR